MAGRKVAIFQFLEVDSRARHGLDEEQHEEIDTNNASATVARIFSYAKELCLLRSTITTT